MKNDPKPPQLLRSFFIWWSGRAELEDLLGDIDEYYLLDLKSKSKLSAQWRYHKQVFSLLFSYALRKRRSAAAYSYYFQTHTFTMWINYFKIASRNFSKHKLFTLINMLGLAMGMSICLLALGVSVAIYKSDEFHKNKRRTYQVNTYVATESEDRTFGSTFGGLGAQMLRDYPFIEEVVNINNDFRPEFEHRGNLMPYRGYYAGAAFFQIFDFQLIQGDPATALSQPFSLVLTQSVAEVLFRDKDPVGEILKTDHGDYTVTGVMEDLKQTHFFFDVLTSYATLEHLQSLNEELLWRDHMETYTYLLLQEGTDPSTLASALTQVSTYAESFHPGKTISLSAVRLDKAVPRWNISNAIGIGWDQPSMIFFMAIGLLILLPAIFNYTNLSIAHALKRAKEIGIRKVVGAENGQIKTQFIVETLLVTMFSLIGATLIFIPLRSEFLDMVRAAKVLDISMGIELVLAFVFFAVIVGLFAGVAPALFFSRMNPLHTLKGGVSGGLGKVSGMKKGLFVFQFFLSLVFIIGVAAIAKQYAYAFNNNHGFDSDNVLVVPFNKVEKQVALHELATHPDVKSITTASNLPGVRLPRRVMATSNDLDTLQVQQVFMGDDFVENFRLKLHWGEIGSSASSTRNEESVLVNQQFLRSMSVFNIQKDTLGFTLEDGTHCRIVGILDDFFFEPLSEHLKPIIFRYSLEESEYALLTINSQNVTATLVALEEIWEGVDKEALFESSFLDDEIEDAYYFLMAQMRIFSYLSAFAITISLLGLLGMVTYTTENRTKEIAIRKIMGASTPTLHYLLTRDFLKLIAISSLIAIPFSYLFYDRLFLFFVIPNGTGLGILEIVGGVVFLFSVGFLSIFFQTSKVTQQNPATNLRYE